MSKKCPFCNSETSEKGQKGIRFKCGVVSMKDLNNNLIEPPHIERTLDCLRYESDQLRAENERLTWKLESCHAEAVGEYAKENAELRDLAKALNAKISQQATELSEMTADYDRFQWLLKQGVAWRGCYRGGWMEGEWLYSEQNSRQEIDEFVTLTEPEDK